MCTITAVTLYVSVQGGQIRAKWLCLQKHVELDLLWRAQVCVLRCQAVPLSSRSHDAEARTQTILDMMELFSLNLCFLRFLLV